jgi:hypothetical protein
MGTDRPMTPFPHEDVPLRSLNWQGSIQVVVTLARTSLSSPSLPAPIHKLLPRQGYLHVGLTPVIKRLSNFAVTPLGSSGDPLIDTWLEDEETRLPLKWHLPTGVLYDLKTIKDSMLNGFQMQQRQQNPPQRPWKLILHFSSYPKMQLLGLQHGMTTLQKYYFNQLKQSLFIQHGTSKVQNNEMTKQVHATLWDALLRNHFDLYHKMMQSNLQCNIYKQCKQQQEQISPALSEKNSKLPAKGAEEAFVDKTANGTSTSEFKTSETNGKEQQPLSLSFGNLSRLPIRLLLDHDKPPIQGPFTATLKSEFELEKVVRMSTLGDLLMTWLPEKFEESYQGYRDKDKRIVQAIKDTNGRTCCSWLIQGVQPPLTSPLADLWCHLCHPDLFLYIIVISKT